MPAGDTQSTRGTTLDPLAHLVTRMVARDEPALTELYDKTVGALFAIALRIVHDRGLAEEVCEDTYFQAWQQAGRYDASRGRVMTWLILMCRSRALDALRALDIAEPTEDVDGLRAHVPSDVSAPDDLLATFRADAQVRRALEDLPAAERQAISLSFFRGLTHEEIAAALRMPVGSVKTLMHRAFKNLRETCAQTWAEYHEH